MAVEKIGVIGAGQMGTGISHVLALAGYDVVLDDINKEALAAALERIEKNMQRQASKGTITMDVIPAALARIKVTQSIDDLRDRDLVIEAATEDETIKKAIFRDLCDKLILRRASRQPARDSWISTVAHQPHRPNRVPQPPTASA